MKATLPCLLLVLAFAISARAGELTLDQARLAVEEHPESARAHLDLAVTYGRLAQKESPRRQIEMAGLIREEAETAVRLDPKLDAGWHVLGRWNYEIASLNPLLKAFAQALYGKFPPASYEKAEDCFTRAAEIQPKRAMHQIELGRTLLALHKKDAARVALQKGLDLPSIAGDDNEAKQRARRALEELN